MRTVYWKLRLRIFPPAVCIEDSREFAVYLAEARQIPLALQEIGRLREMTFRAAGEGTSETIDLDRFDAWYLHLFLWHKERREIAGAYRLGEVPKILARFGPKGLYTESLFRFAPGFFSRLGPSLELGRSFIQPDTSASMRRCCCCGKGSRVCCAKHPQYSTLIGAVSVSNRYSPASRELIVRYFEKQNAAQGWRGAVRARRPLRGNLVQTGRRRRCARCCRTWTIFQRRSRIWSRTARAFRFW